MAWILFVVNIALIGSMAVAVVRAEREALLAEAIVPSRTKRPPRPGAPVFRPSATQPERSWPAGRLQPAHPQGPRAA